MRTKVKIEMLKNCEECKPFKAYKGDAAFDLMSAEYKILNPGERKPFSVGFKMELEEGWEAQIRPRSGNALKKGLTVLNSPGTIDSTYRGVVEVILYNVGKREISIKPGDKIAQMVIQEVPEVELEFVESVNSETDRGENGFGSTGLAG